jgi:uncharacterized protein YceK
MKAKKTLALLLLVGLFGSGCASVSRLNAEYEEELARVEMMSPEEKAEWEQIQRQNETVDWDEFVGGGDE